MSTPSLKYSVAESHAEARALITHYAMSPYRNSVEQLRRQAVLFTGSPHTRRESGRLLLLSDPASEQAFFYEFDPQDILHVEEGTNLSLPDGSPVTMVRLWVKKGAVGLRIEAFTVQDLRTGLGRMWSNVPL